MYCHFFGFAERPFDLTPDPKFLYLSPSHRETLATLTYGIRERRGFIAIVGEVGTGKSTLLKTILGQLDEKTHTAFIFNTSVTFDEMLAMALLDLGLAQPEDRLSKVEMIHRLNDFAIGQFAKGANVVLLVDEAQNLDRSAMENLRLLSNLETSKHKLIQVVLSGQPELDVKLSQPQLRQLAQRISLKRYITFLTRKETEEYIQHRLRTADYSGPELFNRQAKKLTWDYSGGVPRKINVLCDNALLTAYALRKKTIEADVIEETIKDLAWSPFLGSGENRATTPVQPVPSGVPWTLSTDARNMLQDRDQSEWGHPDRAAAARIEHDRPERPDRGFGMAAATQFNKSNEPIESWSGGRPSRSRFSRLASLVTVACIIVLVGFYLGKSRMNLEGGGPFPMWISTQAKMPIQQESAGQPRAPDEKLESSETPDPRDAMVREPADDHRASTDGLIAIERVEPITDSGSPPRDTGTILETYIVKKGDTLSSIILQAYGRYDRDLLTAVLRHNPRIHDPHMILETGVIKLPAEKSL